jgi:hypothetical protein
MVYPRTHAQARGSSLDGTVTRQLNHGSPVGIATFPGQMVFDLFPTEEP